MMERGLVCRCDCEKIGCDKEAIEPYGYMAITAVVNYMIFEEDVFVVLQIGDS